MSTGKFTLADLKTRSGMMTDNFEKKFDDNKVPDYKIRRELSVTGSGNFSTEEKNYIASVLKTERSRIDWGN